MKRIICTSGLALLVAATGVAQSASRVAAASPACTVWSQPADHPERGTVDHPTVLGVQIPVTVPNPVPMTPSTTLVSETIAQDGATLVIRLYVADLDEVLAPGTDGISWQSALWYGNGISYYTWATYSADGSTSFSVNPGGLGVEPQTPVTGHLVTGPGGYAEVDVPLSLLGNPPAGTVLGGLTGTSFANFGAGPVTPLVQWDIDAGGPGKNFTVGGGC